MALLTPPPAAPQRGDRATFASRVDAFITWLINFVGEMLNLVGNLNSIAAGSAYGIPYVWKSAGVSGGMNIGGSSTNQQNAVAFDINNIAANGIDVSPLLAQFDQSSSTVKGYIRVIKANDSSSFLVFAITGRTPVTSSGYQYVTGFAVHASSVNPFATSDLVLMYFQRTGDKGDNSLVQTMWLRDQVPSGTAPQALAQNASTIRRLNTVASNNIPGASLSNNVFTIPAGKYWIEASAASINSAFNQLRLINNSTNGLNDIGLNSYSVSGTDVKSALIRTPLEISATQSFRLEHYVQGANSVGGVAGSSGQPEMYCEIKITRVA